MREREREREREEEETEKSGCLRAKIVSPIHYVQLLGSSSTQIYRKGQLGS